MAGKQTRLVDEEALQLDRRLIETWPSEAVVGQAAFLRDGHEAGGSKQGQVVLDGRLRQLELRRDLGQVTVAVGQQLEDPKPRFVAQRTVKAHDALRRSQPVVALDRR